RFPRGGHLQRQRRLRHPHRHWRIDRTDHAGRRTDRAELYAQLAGAKQSRTPAATILPLRRSSDRRERAWAYLLDRGSAIHRLRRPAGHRRIVADRSAWALGGRPDAPRSSGAGAACRLRLRPARLPVDGRGGSLARNLSNERRLTRLDGGSGRSDDARGYDARKPRPHRPRACCIAADPIDLPLRIHRRSGPHHRGIRAVARASSHRRGGLDPWLRQLCRVLWPPPDGTAAGMERKNLAAKVFRVTAPYQRSRIKAYGGLLISIQLNFEVAGPHLIYRVATGRVFPYD